MTQPCNYLKAIVFDWAGTMIDHGSRAPALVFREIFSGRGVEITEAHARQPMGMAKRDHIAAVAAIDEVAHAWKARFGHPCREEDVDAMYRDFLPLQKSTLAEHCQMIAGATEIATLCRRIGLKIGSSTGYTRELMEVVSAAAKQQGYEPDCVLCAEDAPKGRPAPYLLFEAAKRLDVYPMCCMIKVDDTPVGIEAGRNAGCWTVGITRTGNCVGLSVEQLQALPDEESKRRCDDAAARLTDAGAHFTIESVSELPEIIAELDHRLQQGIVPDVTVAIR